MSEPNWLDKDFVLFLHERLIKETGGSHGVRDEALLESALSRAPNLYAYENADLFDLAAAYAEGISSNHPFVDGNKRAAYAAAGMFLEDNGYVLEIERENEQEELFLKLADGKLSREDLAEWYRENTLTRERAEEREQAKEAERQAREAAEETDRQRQAKEDADRAAFLAEFDRRREEAEKRREQEKDKGKTRTRDC
jgi:death-on-curing protein